MSDQVQCFTNDTYLQFMYERLILLRELLSEKGSIYLHCDWHKSHHLRFLLDEVFGADNFVNEIIWKYRRWSSPGKGFQKMHDSVFLYSKSKNFLWNMQFEEYSDKTVDRDISVDGKTQLNRNNAGVPLSDGWEISYVHSQSLERANYPTQKPEALLERIVKASTNKDSIILDCFMGSGTAQAVAQKLGRRWIGCDMNKGAIQTTSKRLQKIMEDQKNDLHDLHITKFCQYKINNYDFQARHNALQIIIEKYGIVPFPTDSFFDGIIKDNLVKILDLTRPCNLIDIQSIREEINSRDNEERHIIIIASGVEITVEEELEKYNKTHPINKLLITNIQSDGIISSEPAETEIKVIKQDNKAKITIDAYFSPTILKKLDIERTLFQEHIKDFRSQIDMVLIDNDYNGEVFNIYHQDIPEKKKDFIDGVYEVPVASPDAKIAIKIIDMLGEETLFIDG